MWGQASNEVCKCHAIKEPNKFLLELDHLN